MCEFLQTQKRQSPSAGLCAGEKKPLSRWGFYFMKAGGSGHTTANGSPISCGTSRRACR
ncbi:hypothetical protein C4K24_1227 [Pseudomonas chlororaphis subsp. aurantiaca]|nr:hypothetical protein C4K24_1227 [Pseudomonas chlororaphis subsp. aurantiaca]